MELMADGQDEDYGYQFSLVQIDGKDYPQLSRPILFGLTRCSTVFQPTDGPSCLHF